MIETVIPDGCFQIEGRGTVFTALRSKHNFELLGLRGKKIKIEDLIYHVRSIEHFVHEGTSSDPVGLVVVRCNDGGSETVQPSCRICSRQDLEKG